MERYFFAIVHLTLLLGAIIAMLIFIYYSISTIGGAKPEKKKMLPLIGPFMFFFPQLFTAEGNHDRIKTLRWAALVAVLYSAVFFMAYLSKL